LIWLRTAALDLTLLLAGFLLLCGILLSLLHITRKVSNIRIRNMRERLLCLLSGEAKASRMKTKLYEMLHSGSGTGKLSDVRGIRSKRGLRVVAETAGEVSGEVWQKLAAETGSEWYCAYLQKKFGSSDPETILLAVRVAGALHITRFTQNIVTQIYCFRTNAAMQHIGMLSLCMLGAGREIVALCRDESIASLLSFRTLGEIFSTYTGDCRALCRKLITTASDLYIRRTCIKMIGESGYSELGVLVIPFLKSSQLNARIDAVRTIGQIQERDALEQVLPFSKDLRWEMRAVVATALGAFGAAEHLETLLGLLCDREWWVRYRAAQALLRYPNRAALMTRVEETNDRFALEMMRFSLDQEALGKGGANE